MQVLGAIDPACSWLAFQDICPEDICRRTKNPGLLAGHDDLQLLARRSHGLLHSIASCHNPTVFQTPPRADFDGQPTGENK
eukprot:650542-Rhodomonas_salina.2